MDKAKGEPIVIKADDAQLNPARRKGSGKRRPN
jgi:hypothetical protein